MTQNNSDKAWHLDRKVPLALLAGLLIQAAIVVYWGGSFQAQTEERLAQIERRLEAASTRTQALQSQVSDQGQTIAVLLSRIDDTNRNLDRLRGEVSITNQLLRELISSGSQQSRPMP